MSTRSTLTRFAFATAALLLVACGGDKAPATDTAAGGASGPAAAPSNAPKPTGTVITIEMTTDETGNYFKPKDIEAKPGDVLKFVLVAGVHNVHFLADSNPGVPDLPAMSMFAQLPGQEILVPVNFAAGKTYYFQCDPHALLGMVGTLKVEDE
ncbi:plastocyanin/azurin family copper-binding protein [Gemmatimonas sp.]|jgi:plastocyanin|uniref:plastocyanin/azurin family copper-binding protein n=1 Tax=Gemmatimonas sp. TaxID=1962908 RepID=UPI0037BE4D3F